MSNPRFCKKPGQVVAFKVHCERTDQELFLSGLCHRCT